MNARETNEEPPTKRTPATPSWRHTRVVGVAAVVDGAELIDAPGTCAGCRRAFKQHTDDELYACAALCAPTEDQ